jgi:diamine N-acetyltransferase
MPAYACAMTEPGAVSLRPVTRENVRALCELRLADEQERLVAPAAFTVAEGHYEPGATLRAAGWAELETSFVPGDDGAGPFWRSRGFRDTGRLLHGEPVVVRAL